MAQLQAWGGAHLDAMGAYDLRPAVPLLVSPNKFPIKYQSPQEPLMHMMMLGHVYAAVKEELQAALLDPGMSKTNLAILQDLEFLCEFAIPVVEKSDECRSIY